MRSTSAQAFISDLESEDVEAFTDTALGDDLTELRRAMDRIEFQFSRRLELFARRQGYLARFRDAYLLAASRLPALAWRGFAARRGGSQPPVPT
jgi:hypothetical protein